MIRYWGGPWDGHEFSPVLYNRMPRCVIPPPGRIDMGFYWANTHAVRYDWCTNVFPEDDGTIDPGIDLHEWEAHGQAQE